MMKKTNGSRAPCSNPPLAESVVVDVERDISVTCRHCPSLRFTLDTIRPHLATHDRVNHLQALSKVERAAYYQGLKKKKACDILGGVEAELVKVDVCQGSHQCKKNQLGDICKGSELVKCAKTKVTHFTTLRYIKDQQYTIGEEYSSREEQGEFIHLEKGFNEEEETHLRNYFGIVCRDGRYLIHKTMVDEDTMVHVNGIEIVALDDGVLMKMTSLEPGDIIAIANRMSGFQQDFLFKLGHPTGFVEARMCGVEMEVEDEEEEGALRSYFFDNNVVLRQIFLRMNVKDVLPLRLVCRYWDQETYESLKKGATLTVFERNENIEEEMNPFRRLQQQPASASSVRAASMAVFKLVHAIKESPLVNLTKMNVNLPQRPSHLLNLGNKLRDDFCWLFSLELGLGLQLTHLNLTGRSGKDIGIMSVILEGVAQTLQHLKLKLTVSRGQLKDFQVPQLPHVTTLSLNLRLPLRHRSEHDEDDISFKNWFTKLFSALPKLVSFTCEELNPNVLPATFQALITYREGMRACWPMAVTLVAERRGINWAWLESLLSLPHAPSAFYIQAVSGRIVVGSPPSIDERLLSSFMGRWGPGLEKLDLRIDGSQLPWEEGFFFLRLPGSMPRMQSFALTYRGLGCRGRLLFRVMFGVMEGTFDYRQTFPNLHSLELAAQHASAPQDSWDPDYWRDDDGSWEQFGPIYDMFIPRNEEGTSLSENLRVLEVPLVFEGEVRRSPEEIRFSFPNLVNPPETIDTEDLDEIPSNLVPFPDFMVWPALSGNDWEGTQVGDEW